LVFFAHLYGALKIPDNTVFVFLLPNSPVYNPASDAQTIGAWGRNSLCGCSAEVYTLIISVFVSVRAVPASVRFPESFFPGLSLPYNSENS
jgi:hypothetical protein